MISRSCYNCGVKLSKGEHYCTTCGSLQLLEQDSSIYRIQRILGTGGFGRVYQADEYSRSGDRRRSCAIKVIEERPYLSHEHIHEEVNVLWHHASEFAFMPDIYDYWTQSQKHFIVMQFIKGHTLGEDQEDRLPWSPEHVLEFLREVLGHLSQLHASGIIHRDIKPANIKRSPTRGYVLLDFGLASEGEKTVIPGLTPDYAPLEQFYEKRPSHFRTGPRSDLYALASTAYHLLTGKKPTRADRRSEGEQLALPVHPDGVPDLLQHILSWMLELNPDHRPPDAKHVLDLFSSNSSLQLRAWPHDYDDRTVSLAPEVATTILQPSRGRLYSITWSPDSQYLAAGSALGASFYDLKSSASALYPMDIPVQRVVFLGADTLAALTPQHIKLLKFPVALPANDPWQTIHKRSSEYSSNWTFLAAGREKLLVIDDNMIQVLPATSTVKGLSVPELVAGTAALSADGQVVATTNIEGITIWQLEDRRLTFKKSIPIVSDNIKALALTRNGGVLAIGLSNEVRLWDVIHGRAVPEPPRIHGHVIDVDIASDGTMLAVALDVDDTREIQLWSIAPPRLQCILEDTTASIIRVSFSPNGTFLAGHSHEQIKIWSVVSGEREYLFNDYMDSVTSVAYSADGKWLAAMGGGVRVWHVADSGPKLPLELTVHSKNLNGLAFSPDGNMLVTACTAETKVWTLQISSDSGLSVLLKSVSRGIDHGYAVGFIDEDILCAVQGMIERRNADNGMVVQQWPMPNVSADETTIVMTPDGQYMACYSGATVIVWQNGSAYTNELRVDDDISGVAISPNGHVIAVSTELLTSIWKISDLSAERWHVPQGATRIVFDDTGTRLALLSDRDIDVWKLSEGPLVRIARFTGHTEEVRDVAFAPSGRTLASASQDGTVRLWELSE